MTKRFPRGKFRRHHKIIERTTSSWVAQVGASARNEGEAIKWSNGQQLCWYKVTFSLRITCLNDGELSPSSFSESLLNLNPLGSLPTKWWVSSLPRSLTAMAYSRGFTHDCRQKGTLVSPTECLSAEGQGRKTKRFVKENTQEWYLRIDNLQDTLRNMLCRVLNILQENLLPSYH